jgi:hypothetical protein
MFEPSNEAKWWLVKYPEVTDSRGNRYATPAPPLWATLWRLQTFVKARGRRWRLAAMEQRNVREESTDGVTVHMCYTEREARERFRNLLVERGVDVDAVDDSTHWAYFLEVIE